MKCRILFSWYNKKYIINLPPAELAQGVVMVEAKYGDTIAHCLGPERLDLSHM